MIDLNPQSYLATWLHRRTTPGLVVDVGAANGEFARAMRALQPRMPLLLIEPTSDAAAALATAFIGDPDVRVAAVALADQPGRGMLHRYVDGTQNSLLTQRGTAPVASASVEITTLDLLLARQDGLPAPMLVKIDTQGRDLQVLQGALQTLRHHRPLVQVEVIFADLYQHQCRPDELMALMAGEGYHLADMAMPHVDGDGRLAYADWLFTPDTPTWCPSGFACRDADLLASQARMYRDAAAERLALIDRLTAECEARGRIIDQLRGMGA